MSGLWLLNALADKGYRVVLLERERLGGGQTLASQGMIHGGIKYALGGFTTASSESIASMPARWNQGIAGQGSVDLSHVRVLSNDYYLFSDQSVSSRVTAFFGSKSIRGRVNPVKRRDYPPCFDNAAFKGVVYRLQDLVIDTVSLITRLAERHQDRIFKSATQVIAGPAGDVQGLQLDVGTLLADTYIFCAGSGNEDLVKDIRLSSIGMQRRPLHQVMVTGVSLPPIYAHAVSASAGAKPRVTFTTHTAPGGRPVWYLGGNLAETGVNRGEADQIQFAQGEMQALFPWLDWKDAEWRTFRIDRAEPLQRDHSRPDTPFCKRADNAILCWPTKLSLTPLLADEVVKALEDIPPRDVDEYLPSLPTPQVGSPPWEIAF